MNESIKKTAIEKATTRINKFLDLLLGCPDLLTELKNGRLSYKIPCVGRLTQVFGGVAEKKIAIQQLQHRGFIASWKRLPYPKDGTITDSDTIDAIAAQCVPDWCLEKSVTKVGASAFSPPFSKKFDVLLLSLAV